MIEVEQIPLDITLPDDGVGMVVMQPFVELCDREPFCWQNDKKDKQIGRIVRTLEIARQADHSCEKTHFTVFPEYAIPGLEGVRKIQEILESSSWEDGTIVVGGVDGLTKSEYSTLCSESNTEVHQKNKPEKARDGQWINCCIIWAKQTNDSLKRWVQPKLVPATQEELCPASRMFEGKAMYVFRPKIAVQDSKLPFRFLSFICKDWIGNIGGLSVVDLVLSQIDRQKGEGTDRLDIHLCFILKRNPQPDYSPFLQSASRYLNENTCFGIRRSDGAVLFVNNAGINGPGHCTNFGKSGFVFHPSCSFVSHKEYCPPTYTLKKREELTTCKEAGFRESGSCILSFKFFPPIPAIVRKIPATPMIPMRPAIVHSVDATVEGIEGDPRITGQEIPASVKWVNDFLDRIRPLLEHEREHPLRNEINTAHGVVCKEIRTGKDRFLCKYVTMASCGIEKEENKWIKIGEGNINNVDNWDENEEQNLKIVVYSLSIIKVCKPLEVKSSPAHATLKIQDKVIDVIVVCGKTHKDCVEYAKDQYTGSGQRFVVVVTHDGRSSLPERHRKTSIVDVEYDSFRGPHIADPSSRFYHCGYQNLIDSCFHSQSLEELNDRISNIMGV